MYKMQRVSLLRECVQARPCDGRSDLQVVFRKSGAHHINTTAKAFKYVTDNRRLDNGLYSAVQQPALVVCTLVPVIVALLPLPNDHPPDQQEITSCISNKWLYKGNEKESSVKDPFSQICAPPFEGP